MSFEWDNKKAKSNFKKHGIAFEDAVYVFADLHRLEYDDDRVSYGEDRRVTIGTISGELIVLVVFVRRNKIRVITARKVNKDERRKYYKFQSRLK
jgi:uncharacterized DUF497 family protein